MQSYDSWPFMTGFCHLASRFRVITVIPWTSILYPPSVRFSLNNTSSTSPAPTRTSFSTWLISPSIQHPSWLTEYVVWMPASKEFVFSLPNHPTHQILSNGLKKTVLELFLLFDSVNAMIFLTLISLARGYFLPFPGLSLLQFWSPEESSLVTILKSGCTEMSAPIYCLQELVHTWLAQRPLRIQLLAALPPLPYKPSWKTICCPDSKPSHLFLLPPVWNADKLLCRLGPQLQ